MSHRHEPGALKQKNKAHKSRWRTKGQQLDRIAGRTISTKVAHHKRKGSQSKAARKHKSNQVREAKRQAAMEAKRRIGTTHAPPLYLLFVHLQEDTPAAVEVRDKLVQAAVPKHVHTGGSTASEDAHNADSNATHAWTPDFHDVSFYSTRLKKKIAMAVAPNNVHATLELAKVADAVLFVGRPYEDASEDRQLFISCLCAQGVPTTVHILTDLAGMPQKKRSEAKRLFTKEALEVFPEGAVQSVEKPSDYQTCLWGAVNKKRRVVKWREARSHIMADRVEYDAASRELRVTGYIRGPALDVNSLVYLPGLGARQMARVLRAAEPISPDHRKTKARQGAQSAPGDTVAQPNPQLQHNLQSEVEVDPLDAEQTFPTEEELAQADSVQQRAMAVRTQKVRVPKGFSDYQAVWMIGGSDDEDDDQSGDDEAGQQGSSMMLGDDDEDMAEMDQVQRDIWESVKKSNYVGGNAASETSSVNMKAGDDDDGDDDREDDDDEDDDMEEREFILDPQARAKAYDAAMDMTEEQQDLEKLRAANEDREFPDEVDTPLKQPARVRFGKYRGLQSFRHTPWDPKEDLPPQYARIFKFKNFDHTRRRILKELSAQQADEEMAPYLVSEGSYVTVCVADVPETFPQTVDTNMPLVLWALIEHENKMSVAHFLVKMHPTHNTPIKSKERLVFSTGVRRFYAEPIFSSNTSGNKHKFERFLQPGAVAIATTICPVIFPPMPVLCFKEMEDGSQLLVATGTAVHVNPDRVVVKRIRLSGHPFKIHKRSAVIRYMFFDPDDIHWFKPVELVTKLGRRGHIKESLGTHGHMKCTFDRQLKPHDTVLMNLYKRVYPKWKFEEARPAAVETLTLTPLTAEGEEEMNDEDDDDVAQDNSGDEMQA